MDNTVISVIVPVFNEEDSLKELYAQLVAVRESAKLNMEIIFVDDSSTDGSKNILKELAGSDKSCKLVSFNKNYGQTAAIAAGIRASRGSIIVTMDSDLQNDPADIPILIAGLNNGVDVVSGWRRERKDPFISRLLPSMAANAILSFMTGIKLHDFGCTLKAYKREYIENISIHGEMHRFLPAYCAWQGAKITEVVVNHRPRKYGSSKYGFGSRTFKVTLDLLVLKFLLSYITKPIYVFGGVALISFLAGGAVGLWALYRNLYLNVPWMNPLFFVWMLFWALSVVCFLLGLLAEVIVRFYLEVRGFPVYK